ncbi:MAG: hypothetical protein ABJE95_02825 [Byssovorax sp.]
MRTELKALFVGAAAMIGCLWLAGCPGKLRDPGRFTADGGMGGAGGGSPTCPDVPTEILAKKCAGSACHSGATPQLGLDLVSAGVETRVLGKMASECKHPLADPADPTGSQIYIKVAGTDCGGRMPPSAPLPDSEIACVKTWIAGLSGGGTSATSSSTGAGGMGGGGGAASSSSTGP